MEASRLAAILDCTAYREMGESFSTIFFYCDQRWSLMVLNLTPESKKSDTPALF
jgi:hypothetical protein